MYSFEEMTLVTKKTKKTFPYILKENVKTSGAVYFPV